MTGIQIYTVRSLINDEESAVEVMRALSDIGYTSVQLAGGIEAIRLHATAAEKCGMPVCGILTSIDVCEEHGERLIEIAHKLGAFDIGISGAAKCASEARELATRANSFARRVRESGLSFSYHNHSHEFIRVEGGETIMDILLSTFDSELVDLMPDTYWLQHGGIDVRDFLEKYGKRVRILHLKDLKRTPEGVTFAEIGVGNLNMRGIIDTAKKCGITSFIVEQDICDGDPLVSAKISFENLKKIMER